MVRKNYQLPPNPLRPCNFCGVLYRNINHYTRCVIYKRNKALTSKGFPVAYKDECPRCYSLVQYFGQYHRCPDPIRKWNSIVFSLKSSFYLNSLFLSFLSWNFSISIRYSLLCIPFYKPLSMWNITNFKLFWKFCP